MLSWRDRVSIDSTHDSVWFNGQHQASNICHFRVRWQQFLEPILLGEWTESRNYMRLGSLGRNLALSRCLPSHAHRSNCQISTVIETCCSYSFVIKWMHIHLESYGIQDLCRCANNRSKMVKLAWFYIL